MTKDEGKGRKVESGVQAFTTRIRPRYGLRGAAPGGR